MGIRRIAGLTWILLVNSSKPFHPKPVDRVLCSPLHCSNTHTHTHTCTHNFTKPHSPGHEHTQTDRRRRTDKRTHAHMHTRKHSTLCGFRRWWAPHPVGDDPRHPESIGDSPPVTKHATHVALVHHLSQHMQHMWLWFTTYHKTHNTCGFGSPPITTHATHVALVHHLSQHMQHM